MSILLVHVSFIVLMAVPGETRVVSCPGGAAAGTSPLYVLVLLPRSSVGVTGAQLARHDINNHTNILPGYSIQLILLTRESCSANTELDVGINSFLQASLRSPCRPLLATVGLDCSPHTTFFSLSVAGRLNALHFSVASSPIFTTLNDRFPHLWRLHSSAVVYSDVVSAIMDQYIWTRIGIVYSTAYMELASHFKNQMQKENKTVALDLDIGMEFSNNKTMAVVRGLVKQKGVTIIVMMLPSSHIVSLLQLVQANLQPVLAYPQFALIFLEISPADLMNEDGYVEVGNFTHTQIFLHAQFNLTNDTRLENEDYKLFLERYERESRNMRMLNSEYDLSKDLSSGRFLYDEIWALALAVNNSIPVLKDRNLSIDNYTMGQPEITEVIEEQLADVRFQGASGWVEFNQYRGVTTPVDVFWKVNGTSRLVGVYDPLNSSHFKLDIDSNLLPLDRLPQQFNKIPIILAVFLYTIAVVIVLLTSVQLILYLYYRNHSIIKASSPYLSLFMFAGCYLLCIAAILSTTAFYSKLSLQDFNLILAIQKMTAFNGLMLVLIALFIKMLRVYRIFSSKLQRDIGRCWGRLPLLIIILTLTILPNIVLIIINATLKHTSQTNNITIDTGSRLYSEVCFNVTTAGHIVAALFIIVYIAFFALANVYLATNTRKIRYSNFKDTKKINLHITIVVVTLAISNLLYIILVFRGKGVNGAIIKSTEFLIIAACTQLILILPKTLPTVLDIHFPSHKKIYSELFSSWTSHKTNFFTRSNKLSSLF